MPHRSGPLNHPQRWPRPCQVSTPRSFLPLSPPPSSVHGGHPAAKLEASTPSRVQRSTGCPAGRCAPLTHSPWPLPDKSIPSAASWGDLIADCFAVLSLLSSGSFLCLPPPYTVHCHSRHTTRPHAEHPPASSLGRHFGRALTIFASRSRNLVASVSLHTFPSAAPCSHRISGEPRDKRPRHATHDSVPDGNNGCSVPGLLHQPKWFIPYTT